MTQTQVRRIRVGRWNWLLVLSMLAVGSCLSADVLKPGAYYFPRQDTCTAMMDFQKVRAKLNGLDGDARAIELSRGMLAEFSASGAAKCPGASRVTLLAVYVPGVDLYGRPDFSNRTNLMKVEGDAAKLLALGKTADTLTMAQVRGSATVEVF